MFALKGYFKDIYTGGKDKKRNDVSVALEKPNPIYGMIGLLQNGQKYMEENKIEPRKVEPESESESESESENETKNKRESESESESERSAGEAETNIPKKPAPYPKVNLKTMECSYCNRTFTHFGLKRHQMRCPKNPNIGKEKNVEEKVKSKKKLKLKK